MLANASPFPERSARRSATVTISQPLASREEAMAAATRVEAVTMPTAGELLTALNKHGKPNWPAAQARQPVPTTFQSRPQVALNIGGLIADGYLAVEAEDSQQVKNLGKDIVTL